MKTFTAAIAMVGTWVLFAPTGAAQVSRPWRPHNPVSMVDTADRFGLFEGRGHSSSGPSNFNAFNEVHGSLVLNTGWPEDYIIIEPVPAPTQPVPLVVVFHKFGSSQKDMTFNTDFPAEAASRGWYAVCPLAANTQHFASLPSQIHMAAMLDFMVANYPMVDTQRLYGVGFSMGGGAVTNYAARHVDPSKPMLAAIVSLSGGFALNHTYYADPPTHFFLNFWYGNGTAGSADPWKMTRSSVIDFDPFTLAVNTQTDLARNLMNTPLLLARATQDGVPYLPVINDVFVSHMQGLGRTFGPEFDYQFVPLGQDVYDHRWRMMDEAWAFDWLAQHTLTLPTSQRTLADTDGVYYRFFVEQDAANAFTPFTWTIDAPNNTLLLSDTANLRRLTLDTLGAGLDPLQPILVQLATADGLADELVIRDMPAAPSQVIRDGQPTASWSYNSAAQEFTLLESDGLVHNWTIVP